MAAERGRRKRPTEPIAPRPDKADPEPAPFARDPIEPTEDDLADWSRGAAALARMPARRLLSLTEGIIEARKAAQAELDGKIAHIDRLRYETEAMLDSGIGAKLGVQVLATVSTDPPPPMLLERLDPRGHTILYGTGGVGKGTLASMWANVLLDAEHKLLIVDYENHPDEWARRISGFGAGDLMARVLVVAPLTAAWGGKRGAIWDHAEDLRELAQQWGATYQFVDSIVPACAGSDPLKPESVSRYAGALEYMGLPTLSLAHITKAEDLRYPFGSIFWHNLARTTWSLKADGATVLLQHRKHNNYERILPRVVEFMYGERGVPVDVHERAYAEVMSRRISDALIGKSLTVRQLTDQLNEDNLDDEAEPIKEDTVRKALMRGLKATVPKFARTGDKWSNAG